MDGNATNRDAQMLIIDEQELDASIPKNRKLALFAGVVCWQMPLLGWRYGKARRGN